MKTLIEEGMLRSRVQYQPPEDGANIAGQLFAAFKRHSNRTLLLDASHSMEVKEYTGAQILDKTCRIASALIKEAHLEVGQTVLTMCDHTGREVLLALGVLLAGGALFGSSANEGFEEERTLCQLVKPDLIVTKSSQHQLVMQLKSSLPGLESTRVIWIDNPLKKAADTLNGSSGPDSNNNDDSQYYAHLVKQDQVILFDDLIEGPSDEQLVEDVCTRRIDAKRHHVTYMLTSGSTGRPKVVPNTHEELCHGLASMLSACTFHIGSNDDEPEAEVGATRRLMAMSAESVFAGDLPLDHGAGVNTMFLSLYLGAKLVIVPSYEVDAFWQAVSDYRISTSIASTTFTYKLLARLKELIEADETNKWDLSSFQWMSCAGSKLAFKDLVGQVNQVHKQIRIGQCYGCTEIGFISMLNADQCREHLESVGHLMPGLTAKVVAPESGKLCGPNERGELLIWAKSKFKSYRCHGSPEEAQALVNACHDQEGFYRTGDQVHYDAEGLLYVHGRYKETLFLMEDWKILPAELEEVVDQHPLVERSAVVGVPDPELAGCDAPKAFVKLIASESRAFANLADQEAGELKRRLQAGDLEYIAADIFRFVAERTAKPKHLKAGVRILREFPTNGLLNKIDRKALKLIP